MAQKTISPEILNIVKRYKAALVANLDISKVIVFGSQVKGTAKSWSDIDVAVVSPGFGHDRVAEIVLLSRFTDAVDLRIEPHPFHPDELKDHWDSLAKEIRKYGVVVN